MLNCRGGGGSNKQGVDIFLDFHKVGGGHNKMTYGENPNKPLKWGVKIKWRGGYLFSHINLL